MPQFLQRIDHVVVVMLENRSFDNLLGFLYSAQGNQPPQNLPPQNPPTFDGLLLPVVSDRFWNPTNPAFFTNGQPPVKAFASTPVTGPSPYAVPNPDPNELFDNFNFQLFGSTNPRDQDVPTMLGFYLDYLQARGSSAAAASHIMECFSPDQVPVLSQLAKNYAVSDAWFASAPAQTWPNRGFVHTGTSCGQVTNDNVFAYNTKTIFNVLEESGVSWAVYNDSAIRSLTRLQCPFQLGAINYDSHFRGFQRFKLDAATGQLPSYSFVEPSFLLEPNDQHPPHDVLLGDGFLFQVWQSVSSSPKWNQTLLVITYDEHGGCYDHVPPPGNAEIPDQASNPGQMGFRFNRFGVRVPTVVVSPYIEPGTVFRSKTGVPYDHTSILATLRDWLQIPDGTMLPSRRILKAPTLDSVLTRAAPRDGLPAIQQHPQVFLAQANVAAALPVEVTRPLNDLHKSMLVAVEARKRGHDLTEAEKAAFLAGVPTKGDAAKYMAKEGQVHQ
jgi:phospholipase C